jgi:hypothetical protein
VLVQHLFQKAGEGYYSVDMGFRRTEDKAALLWREALALYLLEGFGNVQPATQEVNALTPQPAELVKGACRREGRPTG